LKLLESVSSTYPTFFSDIVLLYLFYFFNQKKTCDVKKKHFDNNTYYEKDNHFISMKVVVCLL